MEKYFSIDSKLTRSEFFRGWLLGCLVLTLIMFAAHKLFFTAGKFLIPIVIAMGFAFMLILVPIWMGARFRDAGYSGKWAFLAIPLFPFVFFICLLLPSKDS